MSFEPVSIDGFIELPKQKGEQDKNVLFRFELRGLCNNGEEATIFIEIPVQSHSVQSMKGIAIKHLGDKLNELLQVMSSGAVGWEIKPTERRKIERYNG